MRRMTMFKLNVKANICRVAFSSVTKYREDVPYQYVCYRKYSTKFRPKKSVGVAGTCMLAVPVLTFCLGTWQIQRRKWKLNLIKLLEEKTNLPPIDLPFDLDELKDLEYRKVKVQGTFDHSKEQFIHPRSLISKGDITGGGLISSVQSGAWVVTPFLLSDRDLTILVNRGWINRKNIDPRTREQGQISGLVELVGVVRHNEKRAPFVPHKKDSSSFWHNRDIIALAAVCETAPVFIDADYESTVPSGPIGGQTRVTLRNEHFSYIITWYLLCAATSFMWYQKYIRGVSLI